MKFLLGAFLIAHALVHASYRRPPHRGRPMGLSGRSTTSPGRRNLSVTNFPSVSLEKTSRSKGMVEETVHIGDTFRIGRVLLEVTQPRVPCFKLGITMGSSQFPKKFLASQRTGYYVRVLEEGRSARAIRLNALPTIRSG